MEIEVRCVLYQYIINYICTLSNQVLSHVISQLLNQVFWIKIFARALDNGQAGGTTRNQFMRMLLCVSAVVCLVLLALEVSRAYKKSS